ncbi:Sugar phosphate isomerase/epimerase [Faunimonas pinastri]|uniref:Sugar phosphate isomerase/epimerase n=1 Tax=Faunimonas pinastri TaxID=1855383 RepID=A0A1H9IFC2_9HYPH|nr:sugar phosphate isomerase/epimerase [Faunimonas pinastri]SEQ73237.1 Sugar phosphate isomerase/epimerase [Faunimonas pinastri]
MKASDVISIQLYSLRNHGDLVRQLDAVADAGYRNVETIGSHFADAAGTARELQARGLKAPSGHVGMGDLRERLDWVVDAARTIGLEQLFMPAFAEADRQGDGAHWKRLGAELGEIARRMEGSGIRFGYHNHHWELAPMEDGRPALAHLFEGAPGAPLAWQADVAWLARGGADPSEWLARESARIISVHVKDIAPAGEKTDEDGWTDVGSGTLDWRKLWAEARSVGAKWMVVEHDNPKHPDTFAKASFDYLARLPV